jgi:hypothetical protein
MWRAMRALSTVALIVGVLLIPTALGVAKFDRDRKISELERTLIAETDQHGGPWRATSAARERSCC